MAGGTYDLVVIGGGINGAGIAAEAATRGVKVLLAEADDLGGATSSASSKLIHGGLRYLEHFEFRLVREALAEREVLLAKAPHIIWPLRFVLPQVEGMRSGLALRAGLFLYDHLASRRSLAKSASVDLSRDPAGAPLKPALSRGFSYWDCWVDDARLVVLNAMAAREAGADVTTRTAVTGVRPASAHWEVTLGTGSSQRTVGARVLVNAAGPWVADVARLIGGGRNIPSPGVRLVKGSHIVVPRIAGANDAYLFQNSDGRVVFAMPFENDFTLIGTTESNFAGDPREVAITADEVGYLLDVANHMFRSKLSQADIVWQFSGVRPLDDDGSEKASAVSRDYRFEVYRGDGRAALHAIGGKITTYRRLAQQALERLAPDLPMLQPPLAAELSLPGGDVGPAGFAAWFDAFAAARPNFPRTTLHALARRYGTRLDRVLGDAQTLDELGADVGGGLRAAEIAYLKSQEWAQTAQDVLWRRTKAGLHIPLRYRAEASRRIEALLSR